MYTYSGLRGLWCHRSVCSSLGAMVAQYHPGQGRATVSTNPLTPASRQPRSGNFDDWEQNTKYLNAAGPPLGGNSLGHFIKQLSCTLIPHQAPSTKHLAKKLEEVDCAAITECKAPLHSGCRWPPAAGRLSTRTIRRAGLPPTRTQAAR